MSNSETSPIIINDSLQERSIAVDREVRELFIPYLESLLIDTEYEGKMSVISQNTESSGENNIVVGITNETDSINAYNGINGADINLDTLYFRHDRDIVIIIEVNMSDNDALWMFSKYLILCLIQDMAKLTSSGKLKIAQHPVNNGISVKDLGARKIWTARLALTAKIHNQASMTAEIY